MRILTATFFTFLPVLMLVSTQLVAAQPENPPPIEVDAFVVNDEANPVPVTVQESAKEIVWGREFLPVENETRTFSWRMLNGDNFQFVPEGYMLAVTDIIVSRGLFSATGKFSVTFWRQDEIGGRARQFDIGGTVTPYSHSFTTPFIVQAGFSLGTSVDDVSTGNTTVNLMASGYLTPVAE